MCFCVKVRLYSDCICFNKQDFKEINDYLEVNMGGYGIYNTIEVIANTVEVKASIDFLYNMLLILRRNFTIFLV